MAWTDEMVEDLRQLWEQGLSASEIAKKIGVSKNSVVGKVHRLCLTARPSPIKKKDEDEAVKAVAKPQKTSKPEKPAKVKKEEASVREVVLEGPVVEAEIEIVTEAPKAEKHHDCNGHVKLVELDSHTCRWPLGDPRDEDFCFCGRKVRMGQTYCEEHATMAYVKATKK